MVGRACTGYVIRYYTVFCRTKIAVGTFTSGKVKGVVGDEEFSCKRADH